MIYYIKINNRNKKYINQKNNQSKIINKSKKKKNNPKQINKINRFLNYKSKFKK